MENANESSAVRPGTHAPAFRHWAGLGTVIFFLSVFAAPEEPDSYLLTLLCTGLIIGGVRFSSAMQYGCHHLLWIVPGCVITSQIHYLSLGGMPHHTSFTDALIHGASNGLFMVLMGWLLVRSLRRICPWTVRRVSAFRRLRRINRLGEINAATDEHRLEREYVSLGPATNLEAALVVLVHGTFAKNAPWTKAGSLLCDRLTHLLGNEACIRAFQWSGENSHEKRIEAGRDLSLYIRTLTAEFPGRDIIVIAHSHGGNVALYALKQDPGLADVVAGIVTMATPFLTIRRRGVQAGARLMAWIAPLLLHLLVVIILVPLGVLTEMWIVGVAVIFSIAFPLFGFKRMQNWIRGPLANRLLARQVEIAQRLSPTPPVLVPLLYAYVSYDEAGMLLRVLHLIGGASHNLLSFLRHLLRLGLLTTLALAIATVAADNILPDRNHFGEILTSRALSALLVASLLYCLALFLAIVWPILVRGHQFGFGKESGLINFLVDIAATVKPPTGVRGEPCSINVRRAAALRHSYLYNSPEFLDKLIAWIAGTSTLAPLQVHKKKPLWLHILSFQSLLAGGVILGLGLSLLPELERDLQIAIAPPEFDRRHPELIHAVRDRQVILRGRYNSSIGNPIEMKTYSNVASCRLIGYVQSKESVLIQLFNSTHRHPDIDISGYGPVDVSLKGTSHNLRVMSITMLPAEVKADLELVCGDFPAR